MPKFDTDFRPQAELPCTLTNDDERRPKSGMGLMRIAFVDQGEHRAAQCLRPANAPVARDLAHGRGDEFHRSIGIDSPMRDEQGARLRIDEGAGEAGQGFGVRGIAGRRVAG